MSVFTPPPVPLVEDPTVLDLRETVRRVLDKRCTATGLMEFVADDRPYDDSLWSTVAGDIGLAGLLIPESYGGAGATAREAAAVMTELGRAVAPIPFLSSAVIATTALVGCAEAGSVTAATILGSLAEASIAALVVPATRHPDSVQPPTVTAEVDSDATTVSGSVLRVLGTGGAACLLVPADLGGTPALVLVAADAAGVAITPRTSVDQTRPTADVTMADAAGTVLATGDTATTVIRTALQIGAALLASEQVGICEWALATGVEYLSVRHQFGRPIGSYQTLRHRAAQLWIDLNHARAAAMYAASTLADECVDSGVALAIAQAYCSGVALHLVEEVLQMHGGIGFTWDHPLHLYLKRAFTDTVILGDAETHKRSLAALIDLAEPVGMKAVDG